MKLHVVALVLLVLVGVSAFADDGNHSANVCSTQNQNVCGHIGHMTGMKSDSEAQFVTHLEIPNNVQVTDLTVKLWMPDMGHGSWPVTITQFGVNKYKITQAYFIMPGSWEVRVAFKLEGVAHELHIPVEIAE
jgi:YtkA-like